MRDEFALAPLTNLENRLVGMNRLSRSGWIRAQSDPRQVLRPATHARLPRSPMRACTYRTIPVPLADRMQHELRVPIIRAAANPTASQRGVWRHRRSVLPGECACRRLSQTHLAENDAQRRSSRGNHTPGCHFPARSLGQCAVVPPTSVLRPDAIYLERLAGGLRQLLKPARRIAADQRGKEASGRQFGQH